VTVRIRMKQFGRRHRPYYRICAVDIRRPRDGRVLEELGTYDPMIPETDARAALNNERINYWVSVGALPSITVQALIKKYGSEGTHLEEQKAAVARLAEKRRRPEPQALLPRPPKPVKKSKKEVAAEAAAAAAAEASATEAAAAKAAETPAAEVPAAEAPAVEAPKAEKPAE
jgi:small subunit ribosomal protein S16